MGKEILINVNSFETRIALLENRNLSEIFIERSKDKGIVGNIYRGMVIKALPGMQVAFIDIGFERSGFLHLRDVSPIEKSSLPNFVQSAKDFEESLENEYDSVNGPLRIKETGLSIEDVLAEGQEIMVQVVKDPLGTKGARISTYISLPGMYLVFMPMIDEIGISRRIESSQERERLKKIVEETRYPGKGYIIRTAAESVSPEELKRDIEFLSRMWEQTQSKNKKASAPALLHRDLDIVLRSIRDLYRPDVQRIVIDSASEYERCIEFAKTYIGNSKPEIELYSADEPIFDAFEIEDEIERTLKRKVWLKSGGYIVIDLTEALTTIDVNTGKFVGRHNEEDTILKTNLEALKEIAYQLKLRNLGGLIIIDFIDMEKEEHKEKVFNALEYALRQDRSRTKILRVSDLGLVEMTRKRTRASLYRILGRPCPHCEGKGFTKSPQTICYGIFREIQKRIAGNPEMKKIMLEVSPQISSTLIEEEYDFLETLETEHNYEITVKVSRDYPDTHYKISLLNIEDRS